jgi:hypothetical protein
MLLRTAPMSRADTFEMRISTMPNLWRSAGIYKASQEIRVEGLLPGLTYSVATRALGPDGISAWSDQAVCGLS